MILLMTCFFLFFFFNDTATTEIYTLSLHDALPISGAYAFLSQGHLEWMALLFWGIFLFWQIFPIFVTDRKSTRLNSSHQIISYAVFCLKKKNTNTSRTSHQTNTVLENRDILSHCSY